MWTSGWSKDVLTKYGILTQDLEVEAKRGSREDERSWIGEEEEILVAQKQNTYFLEIIENDLKWGVLEVKTVMPRIKINIFIND